MNANFDKKRPNLLEYQGKTWRNNCQSVVFTDDFISEMSKQHEHPANDSSHQMSLKWEESNTNIGGMPALSKKARKALKGFNHEDQQCAKRKQLPWCVRKEEWVQIKNQGWSKHPTLSISVFWERRCCLCSWRVRRARASSLMPRQQQHWGAYLRQEAARTERWPQRRRLTWQPHCALSSPGSSMCGTPLAAAEKRSVTFRFTPCSLV